MKTIVRHKRKVVVGVLSIATTIIISGCLIKPTYQPPPANAETASFTIEKTRGGGMFVHTYREFETCKGAIFIAFMENNIARKTVRIPTTSDFVFSLGVGGFGQKRNKACVMIAAFTPEPDRRYFTRIEYEADTNQCLLTVVERTSSGALKAPNNLRERERTTGQFSHNSSFCSQ